LYPIEGFTSVSSRKLFQTARCRRFHKREVRFFRAGLAIAHLVSLLFDYQRDPSARRKPPKRRLADEYDAAQERGEVATGSVQDRQSFPLGTMFAQRPPPKIGLSRKEVHEARQIRDAERRDRASFGDWL